MERAQSFIQENRRAVIITAAVAAAVAAGGAAYYASTSAGASDAGKKKKQRGKKRKTTKDADGPILEERAPKVEITGVSYLQPMPECLTYVPQTTMFHQRKNNFSQSLRRYVYINAPCNLANDS